MIVLEFHRDFLWLLVASRLMIGVGFIGIALELLIIVHYLSTTLLFRRTISLFAMSMGACGISRLVDGYLLLTMTAGPIVSHEAIIWAFDSMSAIISFAAMIIMLPLVWNAMGGHCRITEL